jgi:hypothetical protein
MSEEKRHMCRDCLKALRTREDTKSRRSEIKCTVTNTWLSPFADTCKHFKLRGEDRGIGRALKELIDERVNVKDERNR